MEREMMQKELLQQSECILLVFTFILFYILSFEKPWTKRHTTQNAKANNNVWAFACNNWFCSVWLCFILFFFIIHWLFSPFWHRCWVPGYPKVHAKILNIYETHRFVACNATFCIDHTILRMSYIFFREFKYFCFFFLNLTYVGRSWIAFYFFIAHMLYELELKIVCDFAVVHLSFWKIKKKRASWVLSLDGIKVILMAVYFSFVSFLFSLHHTWNTQNHHDCIL